MKCQWLNGEKGLFRFGLLFSLNQLFAFFQFSRFVDVPAKGKQGKVAFEAEKRENLFYLS